MHLWRYGVDVRAHDGGQLQVTVLNSLSRVTILVESRTPSLGKWGFPSPSRSFERDTLVLRMLANPLSGELAMRNYGKLVRFELGFSSVSSTTIRFPL